MKCKKIEGFDCKSVFTNVLADENIEVVKRVLAGRDVDTVLLAREDYVALVRFCVDFGPFRIPRTWT